MDEDCDPFFLLGLPAGGVGVAHEQLRAAFRRMSLRTHPDKDPSPGAAGRFAKLHAAYAAARERIDSKASRDTAVRSTIERTLHAMKVVLVYWNMRNKAQDEGGDGEQPSSSGACEPSSDGTPPKPEHAPSAPTVHVELPVTLEDLCNARTKRIVLNVMRVDGAGARVQKRQTLLLSLVHHQPEYVFEGVGDDCEHGGARGSVCVRLSIQEHSDYRVDTALSKFDLHTVVHLDPLAYYYGAVVKVPAHPDNGEPISVELTPAHERRCPADGGTRFVRVVPGRGLPYLAAPCSDSDEDDFEGEGRQEQVRGDLYVVLETGLPYVEKHRLLHPDVRRAFGLIWGDSPHSPLPDRRD